MKYLIFILSILTFSISIVVAQDDIILPEVGDVPVANKIQVTVDEDDSTQAIIRGEVGAVFPNAFVVVHNTYTGDQEITSSSSNGEFTASLYGRNQTPYWIAAFQRFPSDNDINEATGTIVYGDGDDKSFYVESDLGGNVPRYRLIGEYESLQIQSGDEWSLNLDIELDIVDDTLLDSLIFSGELHLLPIGDKQIRRGDYTWTSHLLLSDQPILSEPTEPYFFAESTASNIDTDEGILSFQLDFRETISELDYLGRYQVILVGYVQVGDGEREPWGESLLLGTQSSEQNRIQLPISLSNRDTNDTLIWGLSLNNSLYVLEGAIASSLMTDILIILSPDTYTLEPIWIDYLDGQLRDGQVTVRITGLGGQVDTIDADTTQIERELISDLLTLATDSDVLSRYPFMEYGNYQIQLGGRLRIGEQSYFGGGQDTMLNIRIAEPIQLSPSLMVGTPLVVGDTIPIGLHLLPQLPAEVTVNISFWSFDGGLTQLSQTGQANEHGYFVGETISIEQAGHYQIEYQAQYLDETERLWSGSVLSMGMIANSDTKLASGQRGVAGYDGQQQAWFDTRVYPNDDITATRQPYYPFFAGDIAYIPDAPDSGIYPRLTSSNEDSLSYITVSRPDVILRQFIADGDDPSVAFNGDDTFSQQIGAGIDGIRAEDYAFLFGGTVSDNESAIYGALMIVDEDDAPARVLSPFMEQLRIFGQEVELFFVPTGVRPSQVLTIGESLSIAGQVAPTLPADVTVTIISPSGQVSQFGDMANPIGYFYSPENDIIMDEIGIWKIDIDMIFQGETSLGQVERPYPRGNLSYDVYVVPADNPPLIDEVEFMTETRRVTQTYSLAIPDGWTDVRAFATIATPSAILVREELTVFPSGTSYTYNPTILSREYPNLELLETADGNYVADVLTLTLVMTGLDADDNPVIRTQTYTIMHDVTYATDGIMTQ